MKGRSKINRRANEKTEITKTPGLRLQKGVVKAGESVVAPGLKEKLITHGTFIKTQSTGNFLQDEGNAYGCRHSLDDGRREK